MRRQFSDIRGDRRRYKDAARRAPNSAEGFTHEFALSIAVVRHLQLDPLLPAELAADQSPGNILRSTYRRFDEAFKQRMNSAFEAER